MERAGASQVKHQHWYQHLYQHHPGKSMGCYHWHAESSRCSIYLDGWEALDAILAAQLLVCFLITVNRCNCDHPLRKKPQKISDFMVCWSKCLELQQQKEHQNPENSTCKLLATLV